MDIKYKALAALLSNPLYTHLRSKYKEACANCQRVLRNMENEWWLILTAKFQGYVDSEDLQNFNSALKQVYGTSDRLLAPVRDQAAVLLTDWRDVLNRRREHYSVLLNFNNPSDRHVLDRILQRDAIYQVDTRPTLQEVEHVVLTL